MKSAGNYKNKFMISPFELRLGNIVESKGIDFKVSKILFYSGKPADYKTNFAGLWAGKVYQQKGFDKINPIQINEFYLLKFGFDDKNIVIDGVKWYRKRSMNFTFVAIPDKGEITVNKFDIKLNGYSEWKFEYKYVHQLQNLFYNITGEELLPNEADW